MGEAKRKEQALRAALLTECDLWNRPATEWETRQVEAVRQLPITLVQRASASWLARSGMQARECHTNARFYADSDPLGASKQVLGWWRQGDIYVLHSVVLNNGTYICVTPQERDVPDEIPFIPDDAIETRDDGEVLRFYRDGEPITAGLRINPEAHRASVVLTRERLQSGMKPWQAMKLADDEACERLGLPKAPRR